jgi:hypothetical protein
MADRQGSAQPSLELVNPGKRSHDDFKDSMPTTSGDRADLVYRKHEGYKRRNIGSGTGDLSRMSNNLSQPRPADAIHYMSSLEELQRLKIQHQALTRSIVGALSRQSLEELMVDAALEYPDLMNKLIEKNSATHYNPPALQSQNKTQEESRVGSVSSSNEDDNETENNASPIFKFVATPSPVTAYPSTRGLPWTDAEDQILIEGRARNLTFTEMQHKLPLRTKYGAQKRHKRLVELGRIAEHWDPKTNRYVIDRLDGERNTYDESQNNLHQEKDEMTLDDLLSDNEEVYGANPNEEQTGDQERDQISLDDLVSNSESETDVGREYRSLTGKPGGMMLESLYLDARTKITEAKELEDNIQEALRKRHEPDSGHQRQKSGWLPVNSSPSDNKMDSTVIVEMVNGFHTGQTSLDTPTHEHPTADDSSTTALKTWYCNYEGCGAGPYMHKHKRDEHVKNKHINEREKLYCPYSNCDFGPWSYAHKRNEHIKTKHANELLLGTSPSGDNSETATLALNVLASPTMAQVARHPNVAPKSLYCPYEDCIGFGPWSYTHKLNEHIKNKHSFEPLPVELQSSKSTQILMPEASISPTLPSPTVASVASATTTRSTINVVSKTLYCPYEGCEGYGPWTYENGRKAHILAKHSHGTNVEADEAVVRQERRPAVQQFYCDVPGCLSSGPWVQHRTLKNHLKREHNIP